MANRSGRGWRSCRSSSGGASTTGCTPSSPTSSTAWRRTCGSSAPAPTGSGEDVSVHVEDGTSLHEAQPTLPLAGEWTLAGCDHLATLDPWPKPPEWEAARRYRWGEQRVLIRDNTVRSGEIPD
jgi:hypothetical protein